MTLLRACVVAWVLLGGGAKAAAARRVEAERVPAPVRGSGRLVKQVAEGPRKDRRQPEADPPQRRQARVTSSAPALLARTRPALADGRVSAAPAIEMFHITSHLVHKLRPDVKGGGFSTQQMRALSLFLRCHHTNKRKPMDPHLISLLYATARHYKNARLTIISGYRSPEVALQKGNPKSPHKRGVACDFRVDGVPITELRDYLRASYHGIGVGYYPNSGFIHLDVGRKQDAFWIDYSHPGEKARYAAPSDEAPGTDATAGAQADPAPAAAEQHGAPADKSGGGEDPDGEPKAAPPI